MIDIVRAVLIFAITSSAVVLMVQCRTSDSLKVKIGNGFLIGRHLHTHNGRAIRAFMGIPYAMPPVGELRFKVITAVTI